ncbi:MAG: DUF2161 family putative PD-(D/E)XK-type phosphodiesterase [Acholeplasmataceae bacterium]|jgi:hypothetical protein|nr:DUF2161 family putative PD-(D/E)XK-type phosphodiesterase [Acholeplasmataceae bacterium]
MKETDLFIPVRNLLMEWGYDVQGEVLAADVFAVKEENIIIIELKLAISLKLIYQAIERQKVTPSVFIAIPKQVASSHRRKNDHFFTLLKRLGLGLIVVSGNKAEMLLEPQSVQEVKTRSSSAKKRVMLKEYEQRSQYKTLGGTNGKKVTVYKEQVIEVAKALYTLREASIQLIKEYTRIEKASSILQKNYHGWFMKNEKGLYRLSPLGMDELKEHLF